MNLDLISFAVTAPGATLTACTVVTGDPASVRNGRADSSIRLLSAWSKSQAVGRSQVTFPSGNDQIRNITWRNIANQCDDKLPRGMPQRMQPQDPLSVSQIGSAVVGDVETVHLLFHYEDLPGVGGRLLMPAEVEARGVRQVTIEDTITATSASVYSGARAWNANTSLLRANTDYALLGAVVGAPCGVLAVRGTDSGNLRCGIPGLSGNAKITLNWFRDISDYWGIPAIPVFNYANAASIFTEIVQDENLTAVPFSLALVELAP